MNITTLNFKLLPRERIDLPVYKGSTFRGAFGHALKQSVCVMRQTECGRCPLLKNCAYAYLFETRNNRGQQVAHPYVFEPPMAEKRFYNPGEPLFLSVVLIGRANDYIAHLVAAFKRMGQRGVGRKGGRFALDAVYAVRDGQRHMVYDSRDGRVQPLQAQVDITSFKPRDAHEATLYFNTVTALKSGGRVVYDLDFETIIRAIYRRMKALSVYHNNRIAIDLPNRTDHPARVIDSRLKRAFWQRYSNRQEKKIGFAGVVGSLTISGDLTPYTPLLQMGHYVHIGRGTVYGMGKYELEIN